MRFLEEIYTSAPELIEGGASGNLGIVAKSRDFPREIESDLGYQRTYSILEDISLADPTAHPPRLFMQPTGQNHGLLSVTQVVFAGADHTGRTAPLAHHLLFEIKEMTQEKVSTADILAQSRDLFYRQWRRGPTWLEQRSTSTANNRGAATPWAWAQFLPSQQIPHMLATVAEALLLFGTTHRAVVLGIPRAASFQIHALMAEILAFLPPRVQETLTCISHVVDDSDSPSNAALVFTYPECAFFKRHSGRQDSAAPLVFDLTRLEMPPAHGVGTFGDRIAAAIQKQQADEQIEALETEWDKLKIQVSQAALFPRLLDLHDRLTTLTTKSSFDPLAEEVAALCVNLPASTARIEEWCQDMLLRIVTSFPTNQRWVVVAGLYFNLRWPLTLRNAACAQIANHGPEALPFLKSTLGTKLSASAAPVQELAQAMAKDPATVITAIHRATESGDKQDLDVALNLISLARSDSVSVVKKWNEVSMAAPQQVRSIFLQVFCQRLQQKPLGSAELLELEESCVYDGNSIADEAFASSCYLPLMRDRLERGGDPELWKRIAADSVAVAGRTRQASEHLGYLAKRHKPRLTRELLQDWITTTRRKFGEQAARDVQNAIDSTELHEILFPKHNIEVPRTAPGVMARNPLADSQPRNEAPRRSNIVWTLVLFVSLAAAILLLLVGCFSFWVSSSADGMPIRLAFVRALCIGGILLFIGAKIVHARWLFRATYILWADILNLIVFLALTASAYIAAWWALNHLPQALTTWINTKLPWGVF